MSSRPWDVAANSDGRYGLGLLGTCAMLVLPQQGGSAATGVLRYDRAAIAAGQYCGLVTAHPPFAGRDVPVVVDAHLYGASAGLLAAMFLARRRPCGPGDQNPNRPVRQTPERGSTDAQTYATPR